MQWKAKWISPATDMEEVCPRFSLDFDLKRTDIKEATLYITAHGSFVAHLNGERMGDEIMSPGWTSYAHRLQYLTFDVACFLKQQNSLCAIVGKGWYRSRLSHDKDRWHGENMKKPAALLAQLEITYEDGSTQVIITDENWNVAESEVRASTIYYGEVLDAVFKPQKTEKAVVFEDNMDLLIPQEGEPVPDERLEWMKVSFNSRFGKITSCWRKFEGGWRFEIETPVEAEICIGSKTKTLSAGSYVFFAPF